MSRQFPWYLRGNSFEGWVRIWNKLSEKDIEVGTITTCLRNRWVSSVVLAQPGNPRPSVPVTLYRNAGDTQHFLALVDPGAEHTLILGEPDKCQGASVSVEGLGGAKTLAKEVTVCLSIGNSLPQQAQLPSTRLHLGYEHIAWDQQ